MLKKSLFGIVNFLGLSNFLRISKKNNITILSLHRISGERDLFFNPIQPNNFEMLLKYVKKHYSVIHFKDIESVNINSKIPYLILSFDDGYYDFIQYALPLLNKYKLPCNHNVVNSCANQNAIIWTQQLNFIFNYSFNKNVALKFQLDVNISIGIADFNGNWNLFYMNVFQNMLKLTFNERQSILNFKKEELGVDWNYRMMNWKEIIECSNSNVEIGCHTYNHDVLSSITNNLDLYHEVIVSANEIEKKINKDVTILALPNGQSNENILSICQSSKINKILFVEDQLTAISSIQKNKINLFYRISMVDETAAEMQLRTELFHPKLRKYVRL